MLNRLSLILVVLGLFGSALAVEQRHGFFEGVVLKLDDGTHTAVVKLEDGTEHTLHFVKRSAVMGAHGGTMGTEDTFHGLKEGTQVAVHYTAKGSEETADEVDDIGKDGLKSTHATITHIDRGGKTITVKTEDGAEETYKLTDSAARDAGRDVKEAGDKTGKVTVYYTEEAGHKVAHFFKRAI